MPGQGTEIGLGQNRLFPTASCSSRFSIINTHKCASDLHRNTTCIQKTDLLVSVGATKLWGTLVQAKVP